MVNFRDRGADGVQLHCLICGTDIGRPVLYLNEALVVWRDHRKEQADIKHPKGKS
jgi:hypothetical protein